MPRHARRPSDPTPFHPPRPLALAAQLALLGGLAWPCAAMAQPAPQPVSQAEQARPYEIPPGPLGAALRRFAQEAGVFLSAAGELTEGKSSRGLSGQYTPPQAFEALLAGTGLQAVRQANGAYALRAAPAAPAAAAAGQATLPTVTVSARQEPENPVGPVRGYIAQRSQGATKTDTALAETPQSISVIGREHMDDRGVQTVSEAFAYSAGVIGDNVVESRYDKPVVRGFAARQYLDGLYLNYYAGGYLMPRIDPYGLERVELLRGPSSVLYGANAPGGLLNMVSKRPSAEARREIGVQIGSHERRQLQFDTGGALDEGQTVLYRITGLLRDSNTQTEHAKDDRTFLAPSISFRPSADTSFTLLAHYQRDKQGTAINFLPKEGTVVPTAGGRFIGSSFFTGEPAHNVFDREQTALGYALEHRFGEGLKFRQNLRAMNGRLHYTGVYAVGWASPAHLQLRRASLVSSGEFDTLSLDNQLEAQWGSGAVRHTVLAGVDYQQGRFVDLQGFGTVGAGLGLIDPFNPIYGQAANPPASTTEARQKQSQLGLYLQDQIRLGERLNLLIGARQDWAKASTTSTRTVTATGASTVTHSRIDQDRLTGRVGLLYQMPSGLAPYAAYSSSFQPQAGTDAQGRPFAPTTGEQAELGLKYAPADGRRSFTASLFDLRQQNVPTADTAHPGLQIQTGEIRARGLELEGAIEFARGTRLTAAYTHQNTEVTRSNGADLHKTPTNRPRDTFSLWLDQRIGPAGPGGASLGLGARYISSSWGDAANTFRVPSVWLADASLRYTLDPNWLFALSATNLFDKEYIGQCGGATTCYYGYRRQWQATATYRW